MEHVTEQRMQGLYAYAVVPAGLDAARLGTGIDGAPLELVAAGRGVAAVVHRHGAPPYSGDGDEARRRVLEHGEVIERCWHAVGTVLPMGFNVIVAPEDGGGGATAQQRLRTWLEDSAEALSRRLEELAGLVELRVELSLDTHEAAASDPAVRQLEEELQQRPAGIQRLLRRRLDSLRASATDELADRLYPEYRRRLAERAVDLTENARSHPPEGCSTVLSAALLAREQDIPAIGAELGEIDAEEPAVRVAYLGPWPPISFANLPEAPR